MKKYFTILLCVLLAYSVSYSLQDDRLDEFTFDEIELQHETPPYFAVAGGPTFTFQFANFDALNKHLLGNNFQVGDFSGQVNMWGGEGFTGLVYIPNMRAGFFSYGGSKTLSANLSNTVQNGTEMFPTTREIEYKVGMTGISLEYAFVPFKSFAILAGVSLGRGDLTISAYETLDKMDWNEYQPNTNPNSFLNVASTNYWLVKPNVNFEYAITNFLMFRVSASYNTTFGYDWKQNYISSLNNVPDDLNANALQLQAGIFIGLFNY